MMHRRSVVGILVAALMLNLAVAAAPSGAFASHYRFCQDDPLLLPHQYPSTPSGRVTVKYKAENIVDSHRPNYLSEAERIAQEIKDRAEAALNHYGDTFLGFDIPNSITIELRCELLAIADVRVNPFGLQTVDAWAYTGEEDNIQIRNDEIRADFSGAVVAGFQGSAWQQPPARWATLVDHEIFHTIQHHAINLGFDYFFAGEWAITEGGASVAQDLFADADDDPGPNGTGTYYDRVADFFAVAGNGLDGGELDPGCPLCALGGVPLEAYNTAPVLQRWGELYGDPAPTYEQKVASFLDKLIKAEGIGIDAMQNALGVDVYSALREALITFYGRNGAPFWDIVDEITGHALPRGEGSGQAYPTIRDEFHVLPAAPAELSLLNERIGHAQGRVYEIELPAGVATVTASVKAHGGIFGLFEPSALRMAFLPTTRNQGGPNGGVTEVEIDSDLWHVGPLPHEGVVPWTIPVAGYNTLTVIVVGSQNDASFDLVLKDAGSNLALELIQPTQQRSKAIGPSGDLQEFDVRVRPTVDGSVPRRLPKSAFQVSIDSSPAIVKNVFRVGDEYELKVQPVGPLMDGLHDLTTTFLTVADTEVDAIVVGQNPGAAVSLVIDNSGSMGLDNPTRISQARSAAVEFVRQMELDDQVAVVTFNSAATVRRSLMTITDEAVRQTIIDSINQITATGGTNIAAGLSAGNSQLASAQTGYGRAIVLLSDGQDTSNIDAVIATIPADVDAHTIGLGTTADQARLQYIADQTGGEYQFAPSGAELADLYALIRAKVTGTELRSISGGVLAQGESTTVQTAVSPGASRTRFGLRWAGSDFNLTLTSPSGRVITELSTDPDVTVHQGSNFVDIEVGGPEAGHWTLRAEAVDVPSPEAVVFRIEEIDSTVRSEVVVDSEGSAGTPLQVRFILTGSEDGIAAATVVAEVVTPSGIARSFVLTDDGSPLDGGSDDGVYGAEIWATSDAGTYQITVDAIGVDGSGAPFVRQQGASVFLSPIVDTDGDGVADSAEPAFGLVSTDPSDGARDLDGDGQSVAFELGNGLDPWSWDSDGGGELDRSELVAGRDPLDATDDAAIDDPVLVLNLVDGDVIQAFVATEHGLGTVELTRITGSQTVDLGSHPGAGATVNDGPLPADDYWYSAVAVSDAGAESTPIIVGPLAPAPDVTPPQARIVVNGDAWETTSEDVSIEFVDLSEPVVEMRLAESEGALATAPWVSYASPTILTVGPELGVHVIHAQVRDAAGLVSRTAMGVVDLRAGMPEPTTERVSVSSAGDQGNSPSGSLLSATFSTSADGRFITFASDSTNLVAADTNGKRDIFVRDRQTATTSRISVASDDTQGNNLSSSPAISGDGRYVTFDSLATNLVPGDTNGKTDVFVHDRQTGATNRVSVASNGTQGNGNSDRSAISADGRYVAFQSSATNLISGDTNRTPDVFVHDRQTSTTSRVSVAFDGTQSKDSSGNPAISADGRYVAFSSAARNLVPGDTNARGDVFVRDLQTVTTSRVSLASNAIQGNGDSGDAAISADGRYVVYGSSATNLVPADTNGVADIFVHDRQAGTTTRISVASDGTQGNGSSGASTISADGRYVAFGSSATNLVPADTNGVNDAFVHDGQTGALTRVSVAFDGSEGNGSSWYAVVSADGRYVAFTSDATNLVPGDTNGVRDVFIRAAGGGT